MELQMVIMKMLKKHISIFLLFLAFISCEKEVEVEIPLADRKIVIEGYIMEGEHPYVILTRSSPYFATVDSTILLSLIVTDARVYVNDGFITDTLSLSLDANLFPYLIYKSNLVTGEAGKTYSLTVEADGRTFTSASYLAPSIPLDSLWFKVQPGLDSLGWIWAHLNEPDTMGNSYRWFAKRLGKDNDFIAPLGSVFNDKFINGKSFDFAYHRGSKPNSEAIDDNNEERGYFKQGDVVVVKFTSIDRNNFEFWRAAEVEISNSGNPFAAPNIIPSNITGNAYGVWGAYGVWTDTLVTQ
jgi:hypothetical protein